MITDPISDYLTRIRNANRAGHRVVEIPASKIKKEITKILFDQGYILSFKFEKTSCVIPNSLAFSYALGVVNSGNAKKIYIAGFDGYKKGDIKKVNMDQTLKIYNSSKKDKCKIYSLTKTTYKVIKSYL